MKVVIDTNIIVDVALDREPFFTESDRILTLAEEGTIQGYISASTFSDLYYIIRRDKGRDWTLDFLRQLATFCQVATVDNSVISMALTSTFKDFEDAIQYSSAIVNQIDAIVTRNPRDFPVTAPRIVTPDRLIQELTNSP
ncbi:MAG: PIN domain-containing protein [Oscillatoriales cyanobacterium RU_3_3]|nr:PIN domain-containing protein [Oscillatoriales cyanobacterium RU_3_3]NJR25348.1 PIN domain-containing protein [Richelia sp. CSU_2_1]